MRSIKISLGSLSDHAVEAIDELSGVGERWHASLTALATAPKIIRTGRIPQKAYKTRSVVTLDDLFAHARQQRTGRSQF